MYHQGQIHRPTKAVRSTRHTLVGHGSAGRPLPAWKPNVRNQVQSARLAQLPQSAQVYNNIANGASHKTNTSEPGSKVYIQELPKDVTASDVYDLLVGQIGPLSDCYIVHNANGHSKGCAFVHFQRARDGVNACKTFDGKKIDNDNSIRVQLITDPPAAVAPPKQKSLMERLGDFANGSAALTPVSLPARIQPPPSLSAPIAPKGKMRKGPRRAKAQQVRIQVAPAVQQHQQPPHQQVQKYKPKSAQDLDAEMEQYRQQGQGRLGLL